MARFGLVGGSYALPNVTADAQLTRNWYPSIVESQSGASQMVLDPTPGLKQFAALPGMANAGRGAIFHQGRCFFIGETAGQQMLFELSSAGAILRSFAMGPAGGMASLAGNNKSPAQLLVASGGNVYLFDYGANTLTQIVTNPNGAAIQGPVSQVGFSDGYFIALLNTGNTWQISNLLAGSVWQPAQATGISVFADNPIGFIVDHREVVVWGPKQGVVYYNSGNFPFPFDVVPGGFAENGLGATFARDKLDNSVFWLDADERGQGIARRSQGYTPTRISNNAVEFIWSQYPTISDAVSYSYQDQGHTFWVIRFPSANAGQGATWVYDVASGFWHERTSNQGQTAHKSQCYCFAFGKHLVGDPTSGNVYQMEIPSRLGGGWQFADEAGSLIVRERRAPAIAQENKRMFFSRLDLAVETGLGPQPPLLDGQGYPRGPQIWLDWSRDGLTWSNPLFRDCGQAGDHNRLVHWDRLGSDKKLRIFRIMCSDPIPWRITDAYLEGSGYQRPTERLVKRLAQMA